MKKVISIALAVIMIFSLSATVFAATGGSYQQAQTYSNIVRKCPNGCETCTGKVGCNCCTACYGATNSDGMLINIAKLSPCSYNSFIFTDIYDEENHLIQAGDNKVHYYWTPLCCKDCTGLAGCHCGGCEYCPPEEEDNIGETLDNIFTAGRNGFINGIQTALKAVRDVMYDLFARLFEFLRLEDVLGKRPQFPE